MKNAILKNITDRADELARQYNKTKDPGIRDQWFKLLRTEVPVPEYLQVEKDYMCTLDKT
jgi:hypothetical protein